MFLPVSSLQIVQDHRDCTVVSQIQDISNWLTYNVCFMIGANMTKNATQLSARTHTRTRTHTKPCGIHIWFTYRKWK